MAITVIVRQDGHDVPWTFDAASRSHALQLRDEAERRGTLVAWIDTDDARSPKAAPSG